MSKKWYIPVYLFLAITIEAELQWPLASPIIHSSFIPLVPRMLLSSEDNNVSFIDSGAVAFMEQKDSFSPLPMPLGGYILMEHLDAFFSFYAGVQPLTESAVLDGSGYSYEHLLYFGLFDKENMTWINPQLLLPAMANSKKTSLGQFYFEKSAEEKGGEIYVEFSRDPGNSVDPYRLKYAVGNDEIFDISFDNSLFSREYFRIASSDPLAIIIAVSENQLGKSVVFSAQTYEGYTMRKHLQLPSISIK